MFFLDIEPGESVKMFQNRDDEEMFENLQDLIKVREKALILAQNWHIINANGRIEDINENILSIFNMNI